MTTTRIRPGCSLLAAAMLLMALAAPATAQRGVELTIASPADATTMDPGRSTQVLTVNYFANLYDTLTRWDSSLKLQPGLATAWKALNDTTWEVTLRSDVKFHDGTPLTAEDVKATYDRNLVPGRTVVTAGFATIEAVQAVNPTTLRIITKKPDPLMPVRMAQMGGYIYPARFASDEGAKEMARKPVGSGAYRFVEWVKDDRLIMEANREWWGWGGKPAPAERIIWKPIPDDFARLSALQRGEVDVITNVPPDQMKIVRTLTVPATRTVTFWINTTQPPLGDKRVRQALHYAMDVQSIVKNLYAGQGKPFSGGLADTDFGYNPALKPYPYDPERARKLLAEAGQAGGFEVTLYAGTGTMVNDKQLLEALADMWSKVGVRARVQMMEMAQRQKMNNERTLPPHGLMLINPQSTLLDADGSVWRLFHPNGFGGKYWVGSQPGQRFHDLMEQARHTLDAKARKAIYTETTQILHDDKPWLELFQEVVIYGVSKRVSFKPRADYRLIVAEMTVGGR
jgi:peptide/nickel transport system substrate-binding protein